MLQFLWRHINISVDL